MVNESKNFYSPGMSPQALAAKVLKDRFGEEMPSIPIDPFKLMREYGIVYQLMEFENLEGIYRFISKLADLNDYSKAEMHKNQEAATLKMKSYTWNFDIVPCFYAKENFYLIPDGSGNWKKQIQG